MGENPLGEATREESKLQEAKEMSGRCGSEVLRTDCHSCKGGKARLSLSGREKREVRSPEEAEEREGTVRKRPKRRIIQ